MNYSAKCVAGAAAASLFIATAFLTTVARGDQTPEFWQRQSIYQIITDRFFDGDPSNNNADGNYNPSGSRSVHRDDFKGLEQKLDYIKSLGATAIWISHIVLNTVSSSQTLPARPTIYPMGSTLVNLLDTNETATVMASCGLE